MAPCRGGWEPDLTKSSTYPERDTLVPERIKSFLATFAIPALLLASAWGVLQYRVEKKEDTSTHNADIQRLESRDEAIYDLLLDVRCQQQPNDRRCK